MSKIAFIFPGQGAQKTGMGKDFYEQSQRAAEIYDAASKRLKEEMEIDIRTLCFDENDKLDQTAYTQAALVTTCLAMARTLEEKGVRADITAGLSLGEYCAIAVAGGMSDLDAVWAVRKRGVLMEEAVPTGVGAMAAVLGLSAEQIEKVTEEIKGVTVANYNCPGQVVITGETDSVDAAKEKLLECGAKRVLPLNVSGPFHSPMLKEAGEKLSEVLDQIHFHELELPYVTNVTAEPITDICKTKELLKEQVAASVRWQQSMERMIEDGVDTFIEIGPGKTLAGFLKKINRTVTVMNISCIEDVDKVASAVNLCGEL
ncbi:MAG: ACP S-malonyltransferase [Faecalimonas sp.]|uniref:Malonyl CoA-acyl carrier protein transacylase n=1 Tax=Faecalimonas umbilicata TaxID=1912855 RepID=A0A4R3JP23_9FIRM|nr:ACP S-malonyltransferase [Faecalimonas umbilicata]TCS66855.1 [acyl-carrier-protein] S-malonyltransferase [Faecalimonas umbilicata]GBU04969.1 malonyl CoA-acyl carrier protein transacylase [Faecalimonas umbilicata]